MPTPHVYGAENDGSMEGTDRPRWRSPQDRPDFQEPWAGTGPHPARGGGSTGDFSDPQPRPDEDRWPSGRPAAQAEGTSPFQPRGVPPPPSGTSTVNSAQGNPAASGIFEIHGYSRNEDVMTTSDIEKFNAARHRIAAGTDTYTGTAPHPENARNCDGATEKVTVERVNLRETMPGFRASPNISAPRPPFHTAPISPGGGRTALGGWC